MKKTSQELIPLACHDVWLFEPRPYRYKSRIVADRSRKLKVYDTCHKCVAFLGQGTYELHTIPLS